MVGIMRDVDAIKKSKKNQQQGFMFRGIDDMMNSLHSLFAKHGVFILHNINSYDVQERPTKSGGVNFFTRTNITFKFVAEDGSFIEITNIGEAMDSGDKGMNKTMSVALKYALMQAFLIPTEDIADPDAETPAESIDLNEQQALREVDMCRTREELLNVWQKWAKLYGRQGSEFYNRWAIKQNELNKNGNS